MKPFQFAQTAPSVWSRLIPDAGVKSDTVDIQDTQMVDADGNIAITGGTAVTRTVSSRGIMVMTPGDIKVLLSGDPDGQPSTITVSAAPTMIPMNVRRVFDTGTTASIKCGY